ncbi:UNVERIFIED_CONTAM: hypothetical protein NCL1_22412 [Trichonephila clavipes]
MSERNRLHTEEVNFLSKSKLPRPSGIVVSIADAVGRHMPQSLGSNPRVLGFEVWVVALWADSSLKTTRY